MPSTRKTRCASFDKFASWIPVQLDRLHGLRKFDTGLIIDPAPERGQDFPKKAFIKMRRIKQREIEIL